MGLADLQRAELGDQIGALRAEFATWRGRAAPNGKFQKHHTQVERITRQLESFLDAIWPSGEEDGEAARAAQTFAGLGEIQRRLLLAHRIWAYFRGKLALRDVEWLRDGLQVADELAWECYRPAREKAEASGTIAAGTMKEPPLVFFTSEASPFVQARATHFVPEGVTTDDFRRFDAALLLLPIPVLGIPWFQMDHLPGAVVIGHEVGHAVDRDYGVSESLSAAYDALEMPAARLEGWKAWRSEVFADVYSVLCTGPASVRALMAYLAAEPETIRRERLPHPRTGWGAYPSKHLRIQLNLATLREIGLAEAAAGLEADWLATYPDHLMKAYEEDIAKVVNLLLHTPLAVFGDAPLTAVITFTTGDLSTSKRIAGRIKRGSVLGKNEPLRCLFAAATLAYYDAPEKYRENAERTGLLARLIEAIPGGVRGKMAVVSDATQVQADAAQGLALLQLAREQEEARRSEHDANGRTGTGSAERAEEQQEAD